MTEWISIKEKYPEMYEKVLSFSPNDHNKLIIDYIIYIEDEPLWACRRIRDENNYKVTHWMKLPSTDSIEDK